jgi:hypothetical protein
MSVIKVLSIQQPWASLIVQGLKDIENRDWTTRYRGLLLIHAGQRFDPYALDFISDRLSAEEQCRVPMHRRDYQLGGIVGIVKLTDVVTSSSSRWFQGPYGWYFKRAMPLEFYPLKGQLGLFDIHPAVLDAIKREYERKVSA